MKRPELNDEPERLRLLAKQLSARDKARRDGIKLLIDEHKPRAEVVVIDLTGKRR